VPGAEKEGGKRPTKTLLKKHRFGGSEERSQELREKGGAPLYGVRRQLKKRGKGRRRGDAQAEGISTEEVWGRPEV